MAKLWVCSVLCWGCHSEEGSSGCIRGSSSAGSLCKKQEQAGDELPLPPIPCPGGKVLAFADSVEKRSG